jgi:drug/metabolite transporter (DMT)-like permease
MILSVDSCAVGFMVFTRLLASAPAPLVSTCAYVTPLVGVAIGATMLDESLWAARLPEGPW